MLLILQLTGKDSYSLKANGWKRVFYANGKKSKQEQLPLYQIKHTLSHQQFKKRKRNSYHGKGTNSQEDMKIPIIYACNTGAPRFMKQTLPDLKKRQTTIQ